MQNRARSSIVDAQYRIRKSEPYGSFLIQKNGREAINRNLTFTVSTRRETRINNSQKGTGTEL